MAEKEKTQHDRLRDILFAKFGTDWRQGIDLTIRADELSWFVFLIEAGTEHCKLKMKEEKQDFAGIIASLASWSIDLENLVDQTEKVLTTPDKKKK